MSAERIAICQHLHGEGVWWATDEAEPTCVLECDCTPVVYVRADVAAASPRTGQTGDGDGR